LGRCSRLRGNGRNLIDEVSGSVDYPLSAALARTRYASVKDVETANLKGCVYRLKFGVVELLPYHSGRHVQKFHCPGIQSDQRGLSGKVECVLLLVCRYLCCFSASILVANSTYDIRRNHLPRELRIADSYSLLWTQRPIQIRHLRLLQLCHRQIMLARIIGVSKVLNVQQSLLLLHFWRWQPILKIHRVDPTRDEVSQYPLYQSAIRWPWLICLVLLLLLLDELTERIQSCRGILYALILRTLDECILRGEL